MDISINIKNRLCHCCNNHCNNNLPNEVQTQEMCSIEASGKENTNKKETPTSKRNSDLNTIMKQVSSKFRSSKLSSSLLSLSNNNINNNTEADLRCNIVGSNVTYPLNNYVCKNHNNGCSNQVHHLCSLNKKLQLDDSEMDVFCSCRCKDQWQDINTDIGNKNNVTRNTVSILAGPSQVATASTSLSISTENFPWASDLDTVIFNPAAPFNGMYSFEKILDMFNNDKSLFGGLKQTA